MVETYTNPLLCSQCETEFPSHETLSKHQNETKHYGRFRAHAETDSTCGCVVETVEDIHGNYVGDLNAESCRYRMLEKYLEVAESLMNSDLEGMYHDRLKEIDPSFRCSRCSP